MTPIVSTVRMFRPLDVGLGVILGGMAATYVGELPAMALAFALILVGRRTGRRATPSVGARHQEHFRTCNCLGDSSECCVSSCECHADSGSDRDGGAT